MKKKVVQILCHTLNDDGHLDYHIYGNWAARAARSIKRYSNDYTCEVWYGVRKLKKPKRLDKDGITYRLFPAKTLNGLLESFFGLIYCPTLIKAIGHEDPQSTIFNFQGERGSLIHQIIYTYPKLHYTIQYHGYGQPAKFDWLENIFLAPIERVTFPRIGHFFVHIQRRFDYLIGRIGIPKERLSFQNYGVDYERFKPGNKMAARGTLDIPSDAYVMIYVGLMTHTKGVDKMIEAYKRLKPKYPQLYLILIGAQDSDPLKEEVKVADRVLGIVKNDEVPLYLHASDVYLFYGTWKTKEYAGTGTAPNEAIACNINVISTNLMHFPKDIRDKVGYTPKDFEDFVQKIEYLITHPEKQFKARDVIKPYASDQLKTRYSIGIYDSLLQKKRT
ncbi:MAG: Alpha-monoglucosyldiacylglycerol synthase [Microgenomates bacterium OLB22]|nr:MAG: Alpha-monoglucosyldiacylglycerol synthase [Microgenomates bacterium OLB22]